MHKDFPRLYRSLKTPSRKHISDNLTFNKDGELVLDPQMRKELVDFITKLSKFKGGESRIFKAISSQKNDFFLVKWVTRNLEMFWD